MDKKVSKFRSNLISFVCLYVKIHEFVLCIHNTRQIYSRHKCIVQLPSSKQLNPIEHKSPYFSHPLFDSIFLANFHSVQDETHPTTRAKSSTVTNSNKTEGRKGTRPRRSAYCAGKWNGPGCSWCAWFPLCLALKLSIGLSIRLDSSFPSIRYRGCSLLARGSLRKRRRCAERTEERLSRHGLNRASVPTACSRAVNFELVRDATAYVCPECGTKCARSHIRERNRPALSSRSSSLRPRVPASSRSRAYTSSREYTMLRLSLLHSLERVTKLGHACPAFDI